jgi:hypothetical protein
MKTLREFIDQLDEISRRDFLKGAGAAAMTGAGIKPAAAFLSPNDFEKINELLRLRYMYKEAFPSNNNVYDFLAREIEIAIAKFISVHGKDGKEILRSQYSRMYSEMEQLREREKNKSRPYNAFVGWIDKAMDPKLAGKILKEFYQTFELNENIDQDVAENINNEDPISKID